MAPKFGTSGLRGLVTDLTPSLVAAHVKAFLAACPVGAGVFVGRDLRASSPRIADNVVLAARQAGVDVTDCGAVPTPALALAAQASGAGAIMVTGSHIPDDRNGLKFYTLMGEITKADEASILAALGAVEGGDKRGSNQIAARLAHDPAPAFVARYAKAFGNAALSGRRIVVWSHSAVGRDVLIETLSALGAEVIETGRSERFIPLDTEAVSETDRAYLRGLAKTYQPFAIVSTDGDGDRPLVADAHGELVAGDVLGQIAARLLGAECVVTPVSSNSGVEACGAFPQVSRCRIGSPYVIDAMARAAGRTVGYEANGGFLLGFDADGLTGPLPALMTRDSHLPIIAALVAADDAGLAARVAAEPARFTAADRLQDIPSETGQTLVSDLHVNAPQRARFLDHLGHGQPVHIDTTDGLRLTLESARIVHLRPSGNAPELRLYVEAESPEIARDLRQKGIALLKTWLSAE